jgi:hypothetical protein
VDAPISSQAGKLAVSLEAGAAVNVNAAVETNGGGFTSHVTGITPDTSSDTTDSTTASTDTSSETSTGNATGNTDTTSADATGNTDTSTDGTTDSKGDTGSGTSSGASTTTASGDTTTDDGTTTTAQTDSGTNTDTNTDTSSTTDSATVTQGIDSTTQVAAGSAQSTADTSYVLVKDTVSTHGGDISVDAGDTGAALVTGTLDSSNTDAGRTGGDIEVLGRDVVLAGDAVVDSSGDAGGGDINIGGDYQGKGERRQSRTTTVGKDVTIRSDATGDGDAGDVVVWSKGTTRFSGSISARGGPEGGDGGDVEVSGKQNLGFWGTVDAAAPQGAGGSLLLDPKTMTIIDAEEGDGELDADPFCDGNHDSCSLPVPQFAIDDLTPEEFAALGIDPKPNTELNTISWGRLQHLAQATGFGIVLQAKKKVTIAPLNGTVSTRGTPIGGTTGWTVTLALSDPARQRTNSIGLSITSTRGNIVFANRDDNLAVYGGNLIFSAPEGNLRLGNLYGLGPTEQVPDPVSWRFTSVYLSAGGDIEVGSINTRDEPARFANPDTGALIPQSLVLDSPSPSLVNVSDLDPDTFFSDPFIGGSVSLASTNGNINISGPVYTGSNAFTAVTGPNGTFTATDIDTGANRLWVTPFPSGEPLLETLNTGDVSITADKITFDTIHAGNVDLEAQTYAMDAITGEVTIDNFSSLDFNDVEVGTRPVADSGLAVFVGPPSLFHSDCLPACIYGTAGNVPLVMDSVDVGDAEAAGYNSGDKLSDANSNLSLGGVVDRNLTDEFTFFGGTQSVGIIVGAIEVPMPRTAGGDFIVAPPEGGPAPIAVPLVPNASVPAPGQGQPSLPSLVVTSGGANTSATLMPSAQIPAGPGTAGNAPITVGLSVFGDEQSSGNKKVEEEDAGNGEQAENENKNEKTAEKMKDKCRNEERRLAWLTRGPHDTAHGVDWGQRQSVGTNPATTDDALRRDECYFQEQASSGNAADAG